MQLTVTREDRTMTAEIRPAPYGLVRITLDPPTDEGVTLTQVEALIVSRAILETVRGLRRQHTP